METVSIEIFAIHLLRGWKPSRSQREKGKNSSLLTLLKNTKLIFSDILWELLGMKMDKKIKKHKSRAGGLLIEKNQYPILFQRPGLKKVWFSLI